LVASDFSAEFVSLSERNTRQALSTRLPSPPGQVPIQFKVADAMDLSAFPDHSFDAVYSVTAIKHFPDPVRGLREFLRVLKPGGRFLCLEFSHVEGPLLKRAYDVYSFTELPRLGAAVAGDREAYQYLVESIRRFPTRRKLLAMMEAAGLEKTSVRPLSAGIAAIHSGWRL